MPVLRLPSRREPDPQGDDVADGASISAAARHFAARDLKSAEEACRRLIRRQPRHFDALHLLGVVLIRQSRYKDALPFLLRAAAEQPDVALLQSNLASAYLGLSRYDDALAASYRAIDLSPANADQFNTLGTIHKNLDQPEAAIEAYSTAITLEPAHAPALFNLGTLLAKQDRWAEALATLRRAEQAAPPDAPLDKIADLTKEIGRCLMAVGDPQAAIESCRRFLALHPDQPAVRSNLALALLLTGQFEEGWQAYESRWEDAGNDPLPPGATIIDPDKLAGKRVLILAEQGRGDVIQFIRYVSLLAECGATVLVQVYPDLVELVRAMPSASQVISTDDPVPDVDLRTPVMSLPLAFRTTLSHVPAGVPYLAVPQVRLVRWRDRLGPGRRRRIGVAWSGSAHSYGRSAVPAALLAPAFDLVDAEWHCLQSEIREGDRAWLAAEAPHVHLHDHALVDFADTAALISCLDEVVTVDTAVAHLAGALAHPVRILLPFNPDFRWLLTRTTSPWYPTARLYRQPSPGDWPSAVRDLVATLG